MKKAIIGSIVGALIIFIWQFLSFALINFHKPAQEYTDKQEAIMGFLDGQGLKDGGYLFPMFLQQQAMTKRNWLGRNQMVNPGQESNIIT